MTTLNEALGLIGNGDILIDIMSDTGVLSGTYIDVGNGKSFEITPSSNIREQISRKRLTSGQVLATAAQVQPTKVKINIETANRRNLRMALLASETVIDTAVETVVDAVITIPADGWFKLAHDNIDPAQPITLKTAADAASTHVLGEDFELDYWTGMVRAIPGGSITADFSGKLSYKTLASTGYTLAGGVKPLIKARVMLVGSNEADNQRHRCILWEANVKPESGVDLLSEDWVSMGLELTLVTPAGRLSPFEFTRYEAKPV